MAHHKRFHLDRSVTESSAFQLQSRTVGNIQKVEEEEAADVDEPPERKMYFERRSQATPTKMDSQTSSSTNQSLLTKALLTSPNLKGVSSIDTSMARAHSTTSNHSVVSAVSTADLTSDGGLTSPARSSTPSPPLPSTFHQNLPMLTPKGLDELDNTHADVIRLPSAQADPPKRHITFACSRPKEERVAEEKKVVAEEPPKRKCMLRFACPSKPSQDVETTPKAPRHRRSVSPAVIDTAAANKLQAPSLERQHRDSESTVKDDEAAEQDDVKSTASSPEASRSEALRFHEFAAAKPEEEGWTMQKPSSRKITVSDTLRKENAIRKLGEEAEEEALEEEEEEDIDNEDEDMEHDDDEDSEDDMLDDGNETDDEEGFAASDNESEADSEYQFWTPAITTAATSTEHLDHIRPKTRRTTSESSIESMVNTAALPIERMNRPKHHKSKRRGSPKMRPGTPELPDSTDFVCGTLDEDRPLEVAYLSCMEQRRIARHGVLPQDVDPSFPTSDVEDEEDDDEDEEDEVAIASDSHAWVTGKPDDSDDGAQVPRSRAPVPRTGRTKSPVLSPKRMRSPPPKRRNKSPAPAPQRSHAARSPPPRRLFGQSPRRAHSPPPRHLKSPPGSYTDNHRGINFAPALAQRPQLTHTKSLPRTPNPFWTEHRRMRLDILRRQTDDTQDNASDSNGAADFHSRGPIDIVQGLERKRQRRKEKFWRNHCRHANAKDKERRFPAGKGAQRMREVGLEMSERCKGYGQRLQLVLSV